jgi:hypothetical protein
VRDHVLVVGTCLQATCLLLQERTPDKSIPRQALRAMLESPPLQGEGWVGMVLKAQAATELFAMDGALQKISATQHRRLPPAFSISSSFTAPMRKPHDPSCARCTSVNAAAARSLIHTRSSFNAIALPA